MARHIFYAKVDPNVKSSEVVIDPPSDYNKSHISSSVKYKSMPIDLKLLCFKGEVQ